MAEISIDSLSEAIASECRSYGEEAKKAAKKAINSVAKEASEKLKQTSQKGANYKRERHYRDGWRVKTDNSGSEFSATVHNKTDWQLTHLLENGHALPQGGRAKAYPHIRPVEEWANDEAVKRTEDELNGIS